MPLVSTFGAAASRGFGLFSAPAAVLDDYFEYVTMLLPGNGTNGAQNNTFLDSSTNNFTITRNGNTTQGTFSPYGDNWSNYFDGSGDYLSNSSNAIIAATGDFTVECWIYLNNLSALQYIFSVSSSSTLFEIYISTSGGIGVQTGSNYVETAAGTLVANTWYHLAVTRSGSTYTTYLNGVSQTYTASGGTMLSTLGTTPTAIGARSGGSNAVLAGYVSNFRVVTSVVYSSNFTPSTTPLTAITNTSLLTCQSNRFIDNSTNAFTITVNGNTSVQRFSPFSPTASYASGTIGGSGYFDGSGDNLSIADNANLQFGTSDYTIEGWLYPISNGNTDKAIVTKDASGQRSWGVQLRSSYGLAFWVGSSNLTGTNSINLYAWTHFAVVRSGTSGAFFINGTRVATFSDANNYTQTAPVEIGGSVPVWNDPANAYIANVRLVKGSAVYSPSSTTLTVPTSPVTAITNTQLLCNMTNGGIIDNAMMNDLETVGNAQISTAVSKFGGGSMAFDGTGDRLVGVNTPNLNFGSGPWTIEFWIYATDQALGPIVNQCSQSASAGWGVWAYNGSTGTSRRLTVFLNGANFSLTTAADAWASNTWTHIAVVKSGTNLTVYANGNSVATSSSAPSSITDTTAPPMIGATVSGVNWGVSYDFNGYIDDLRITKGVARYTANFTPPTQAFPTR